MQFIRCYGQKGVLGGSKTGEFLYPKVRGMGLYAKLAKGRPQQIWMNLGFLKYYEHVKHSLKNSPGHVQTA
jgi:hypothetical protein